MKTYSELKEEFNEWLATDKDVQYFWKLNKAGNSNYIYADMYAQGVSKKWAELLTDAYGTEINGTNEIIGQISNEIASGYRKAYSESAYYAKNVQNGINAKMNFGIKAIEPKIDEDQISSLITILEDYDTTDAMKAHLLSESAIEPVARKAVSETIKANARFQSDAGIYAYVERDAGSGCCKWCSDLVGRYEFGSQPKDFFMVHNGCTCTIDYKPSRSRDAVKLRYNASQGRFSE